MALVVSKEVKKLFHSRGLRSSKKALEVLNKEVENICQRAADVALANRLRVVQGAHIPKMGVFLSATSEEDNGF